jgi:hypothetical protein
MEKILIFVEKMKRFMICLKNDSEEELEDVTFTAKGIRSVNAFMKLCVRPKEKFGIHSALRLFTSRFKC